MSSHLVPLGVIWGSVVLLAVLTVLAWRQEPRRAASLFATAMLCATWWAASSALGLVADSPAMQAFWANVEWGGVAFVPVAWLLFALEYTGRDRYVTVRSALALSVIPTVTLSFVMTNSAHDLIFRSATQVRVGPLTVLDLEFGPWMWFQSLYAYVLLAAGLVLILQLAVENRDLYLDQVLALLLVVLPPAVASLAYLFSLGPFDVLDPTPYTFVLSGFAGIVALKRYRFLDAVPVTERVAGRSLIDELDHGVVVVDASDHVVKVNPAAADLLDAADAVGADAAEVVPEYASVVATGADERRTVTVDRDSRERIYEVQVTDLESGGGDGSGAVLVFHDVTRQRTRLQRLDVLNRVLRHNLRNEMNVVYGHADRIEATDDPRERTEAARQIKEKALAMSAIGDRAREIDDVLRERRDPAETETLATLLHWERDRVARDHPSVSVECDPPDSAREFPNALETVLKILVEEIVYHNDETDLVVTITATVEDGEATVAIEDTADGIPESEREILESGEETELRHGSGLGLWLANWGIQAIDGELSFTDGPTAGTVVEISVPAVEPGRTGSTDR